jgi:hypothetical protein
MFDRVPPTLTYDSVRADFATLYDVTIAMTPREEELIGALEEAIMEGLEWAYLSKVRYVRFDHCSSAV